MMVEGESTDEAHIQASIKLLEEFRAENQEFLFTQLGPQSCQNHAANQNYRQQPNLHGKSCFMGNGR